MNQTQSNQNLPQAALIGISGYGRTHLRTLEALQTEGVLQIAAATVVNRSEEEESCQRLESQGCRIYPDYEMMLREEKGRIDLCCIPTGIAWHRPMTLAALEAGCHVLVEKPAAGTVDEIDEMIEAQKAAGKMVFVGFQDFYLDTVIEIKKKILAGRIGEVKSIRSIGSWPRPKSYYTRNNWAGKIRSNGHLVYDSPANNAFAHYLIATLNFAGEKMSSIASAKEVEAELYRLPGIETFDTISARVVTENGIEIDYAVTHKGIRTIEPTLDILGTEGRIRWNFDKKFTIFPDEEEIISIGADFSRESMFRKVIESIHTGTHQGCSLEMAREHTKLIQTIHQKFTISEFPADLVRQGELAGEAFPHVEGIEEALEEILRKGGMISDSLSAQPSA
ncbi:Gfo/Idh/MocA family protein [Puniceicoccus vermicola]|uniref:Gfo/Idh/MocA family oxidoreductase n=1 Tax=Puniceicoccus vermicola TaxID=388746 RepID=A0A7X1E5N0_9BACT|nr:Gfo/Idh/MocA family oxidoreductase [Puniceicoccus vermicola]MBC2603815.1 Gfo/Idh/MocA family oxidoreductase [Puniceicoccus vermicola]